MATCGLFFKITDCKLWYTSNPQPNNATGPILKPCTRTGGFGATRPRHSVSNARIPCNRAISIPRVCKGGNPPAWGKSVTPASVKIFSKADTRLSTRAFDQATRVNLISSLTLTKALAAHATGRATRNPRATAPTY